MMAKDPSANEQFAVYAKGMSKEEHIRFGYEFKRFRAELFCHMHPPEIGGDTKFNKTSPEMKAMWKVYKALCTLQAQLVGAAYRDCSWEGEDEEYMKVYYGDSYGGDEEAQMELEKRHSGEENR